MTRDFLKIIGNPLHDDIKVYAVGCRLSRKREADSAELRAFARELMQGISAACEDRGAKVIGHIKAHLGHEGGFLHAHTVGDPEDITVDGKDGGAVRDFMLVVNSVVFGLSDQAIKEATESSLESLRTKYGFARES